MSTLVAAGIHDVLGKPSRGAIEIGCGVGAQTAALAALGWQILGVDAGDFEPNEGFPFLRLDVMEAPPPTGGGYGTVICTEMADRVAGADNIEVLVAYVAGSARDTIVWRASDLQHWWLQAFEKHGWVVDKERTTRLRSRLLAVLPPQGATALCVLQRVQAVQSTKPMLVMPTVRADVIPTIAVVDDFLVNPDRAREIALGQTYTKQGSAGVRSNERFHNLVDRKVFETLIGGKRITDWEEQPINGRFQYCTAEDPIVYHADSQSHAAIVMLTPDAPVEAGTRFLRSRATGARRSPTDPAEAAATFNGNLLDSTKWDTVDVVGNVYNRLAIWDARMIHAAACYFGTKPTDARLFWMFFFNAE